MNGRYEQCLRLRDQAVKYVERYLEGLGTTIETEYADQQVKIWYRPRNGKARSLTIIAYWDQGFYIWVVWKGEDGERRMFTLKSGAIPQGAQSFRSWITYLLSCNHTLALVMFDHYGCFTERARFW